MHTSLCKHAAFGILQLCNIASGWLHKQSFIVSDANELIGTREQLLCENGEIHKRLTSSTK